MKKSAVVVLALLSMVILSSCDKSCKPTKFQQLYEVTLSKELKVSQIDVSTGSVVGQTSFAVGTKVLVYGEAGLQMGKPFMARTGSFVVMNDSTGPASFLCNGCMEGTISNLQPTSYSLCEGDTTVVCPCSNVVGTTENPGMASGIPIPVGSTLSICWPDEVPPPAPDTHHNVPPGTPVVWSESLGGPPKSGILEMPIMITVH